MTGFAPGSWKPHELPWPLPAACWVPRLGERADGHQPGRPRGGRMGDKLPDPGHAFGGRLRVVAELLRHVAGAAADAELPHGAPDRFRDRLGGRVVRPLEP